MRRRVVLAGVVVAALAAAGVRRYRGDRARAQARLDAVDRRVIPTRFGPLEFAERGSGPAVLVSHGIFHGCDGGLVSVRDLLDDCRVVAPSRFGYLGSARPPGATAASQADAFVALLDHLGLDAVDVVAISAGTTAAVQLGLRHPHRVRHLVFASGSFPGSATAQAPPGWARAFYSDAALWALATLVRPAFARLMGVPDGFPRNADEERELDELLGSIFPVGPRVAGAVFDAYVANPEITACRLEDLAVPTLVVHARDDPLASYAAAAAAAARIPGAVLVTLDTGGHLQLGQADRVRAEIMAFLAGRAR